METEKTASERLKSPRSTFHKTAKPGVLYLIDPVTGGKTFYIRYRTRQDGKEHFEKAWIEKGGARIQAASITEAKDARNDAIRGKALPNETRRQEEKAALEKEEGRWTIDRLWAAWMADPDHKDRGGTYKADRLYKKHLAGPFGSKTPDEIGELDVDRLRLKLAEEHAAATTDKVIKRLKAIVNYGNEKKHSPLLSFKIVTREKKMGKEPQAKRSPNERELAAIVKVCSTWPDRQVAAFMMFMMYTGLRRSTAWALKWEHLDLENATAYVPTKTGKKEIVLSSQAVELLKNHPCEDPKGYVFTGWGVEDYKDADGKPRRTEPKRLPRLTLNQACKHPRRILLEAGIPDGELDPCHGFRRNLATTLDAAGASTKTIMKIGGWATQDMVLRYINPTSKTLRSAADIMGEAIKKAMGEVS